MNYYGKNENDLNQVEKKLLCFDNLLLRLMVDSRNKKLSTIAKKLIENTVEQSIFMRYLIVGEMLGLIDPTNHRTSDELDSFIDDVDNSIYGFEKFRYAVIQNEMSNVIKMFS